MPSPKRTPLPLAYRLPNPPALFVGRRAEMSALGAALERGPVAVVAGDGGVGKSALALSYLRQRRPEHVDETIFVSLRGGDAREPVALGVVRALVQASGLAGVDWAALLGAPGALSGFALDLAEEREAWVLLDDLHHAGPADVVAFLRAAARYARKSRWIATTRAAPAADELAGQIVSLGGMKVPDLLKLARALDPEASPSALRRAALASGGSPWLLRRMRSGAPHPVAPHDDLLGDCVEETRAFLLALSLTSSPIPEALLARIGPYPAEDLATLEQRGLIERSGAGVRLHDLTREALPPVPDDPSWRSWRAEAAAALADAPDLGLRFEATVLFLDAALPEEAARLLEASGEALLGAGYALAVWRILEASNATNVTLDRWRLRAAADLADAEVLARARPPRADAPAARFYWAKLLHAAGRVADASAIAGAVHAEAVRAGDAPLAFAAGLLWGQTIGNAGDTREAVRLLETLSPPDATGAAERDSLVAMSLAIAGAHDAALDRALAVQKVLPDLPPHVRMRAGRRVARSLSVLGHLRETREVLDAFFVDGAGTSARLEVGRDLLYARAALLIDLGDLAAGLDAIARLEPYVARPSILYPYLAGMRAYLLLGAGDLDGAEASLAEASEGDGAAQLHDEIDIMKIRIATLRRAPCPVAPIDARTPSIFGSFLRVAAAEHAARSGRAEAARAALAGIPDQNVELKVVAAVARAAAELVAGQPEEALRGALGAASAAEAAAFALREAEARQLVCEIALVLGRLAVAVRAADDLARVAAAISSPRFQSAARLYGMLAQGAPDVAVLEELATGAVPDVTAHARALLGHDAPGDAIDLAVREAILARGFTPPRAVTAAAARGAPWQPGWGLDEARRQVWLPDGRRVDLARHPMPWRLLDRLAARGGAATKEALVTDVWEEKSYHPLRHDNRLHAAVRKLRVEIEGDPSRPVRVLTTEDGYALGGAVRRA